MRGLERKIGHGGGVRGLGIGRGDWANGFLSLADVSCVSFLRCGEV